MYQFFADDENINKDNKTVIISGSDVNHIKNVLRMKPGEELNVSNGFDGKEYRCAVREFEDDQVICELLFINEDSHELETKVFLFQGLPKSDKFETVIQKNVELGVFRIIPVCMKRCVVKLDEKKAKAKTARWNEISQSAAKQSKRGIVPEVAEPMEYKNALKYAAENCDVLLLPYEMAEDMEHTRKLLEGIKKGSKVAIFIGPEGGFEDNEIDEALNAGFETITLGKRILRTETAGMYLMSVLSYLGE